MAWLPPFPGSRCLRDEPAASESTSWRSDPNWASGFAADLHDGLGLCPYADDVRGPAFCALRAQLVGELLRFARELFHDVGLGDRSDDLTFNEDLAFLFPGGDADVGLARLPRSVYDAPHHGD